MGSTARRSPTSRRAHAAAPRTIGDWSPRALINGSTARGSPSFRRVHAALARTFPSQAPNAFTSGAMALGSFILASSSHALLEPLRLSYIRSPSGSFRFFNATAAASRTPFSGSPKAFTSGSTARGSPILPRAFAAASRTLESLSSNNSTMISVFFAYSALEISLRSAQWDSVPRSRRRQAANPTLNRIWPMNHRDAQSQGHGSLPADGDMDKDRFAILRSLALSITVMKPLRRSGSATSAATVRSISLPHGSSHGAG